MGQVPPGRVPVTVRGTCRFEPCPGDGPWVMARGATQMAAAPTRRGSVRARPAGPRVVRALGEPRPVLAGLGQEPVAVLGRDPLPEVPHRQRDAKGACARAHQLRHPRHRRHCARYAVGDKRPPHRCVEARSAGTDASSRDGRSAAMRPTAVRTSTVPTAARGRASAQPSRPSDGRRCGGNTNSAAMATASTDEPSIARI